MNEIALIGLLCTILGAVGTFLTLKRNFSQDTRADATKDGEIKTTLAYISKGVDDIRLDIKSQDRKISDINERLIRAEESTKSAHKRIDTIEKEGL